MSIENEGLPMFNGMEQKETEKNKILEDLRTKVLKFRSDIESAWGKSTAYPEFKDRRDTGRHKAKGQGAVTARLLKDIINEKFPGLEPKNVVGTISIDSQQRTTEGKHAWIEIPLDGDTLILDVTPDQNEALGIESAPVILTTKTELSSLGFHFNAMYEDTDQKMISSKSRSYERYQILKRRYHKVIEQQAYLNELNNSNVFIIASVGAGKTELLSGLQETTKLGAIDVGKLFRTAALLILDDNEDNAIRPEIEKIKQGDEKEKDRIIGASFKKTKLFERGLLDETTMRRREEGGYEILYKGKDVAERLEEEDIATLVPVLAKSPKLRETVWRWINQYAKSSGGVILTGHTLKDIDTTKYTVIQLTVDENVASERLANRAPDTYTTQESALSEIQRRNDDDRIDVMTSLLKKIRGVANIDTSTLSIDQVRFRALRHIVRQAREKQHRKAVQAESELKREQFSWEINPLLANIRVMGNETIAQVAQAYKGEGVTEFDTAVQTMMHLAAYEPQDVWIGDPTIIHDAIQLIRSNEISGARELFITAIGQEKIKLNEELVFTEANRQARRLIDIFNSTTVSIAGVEWYVPAKYMGDHDAGPFRGYDREQLQVAKDKQEFIIDEHTGEKILVVREKTTGKQISFKRVIPEISSLYGRGFHYLHEGRKDEVAAYGAYLEGDILPFAWVSYSPVGREYKQEMLEHLDVEAHRILEMTRAWNASWSPKNTMSILFAHAHTELTRMSQTQVDAGNLDKPLAGIVTAINGNLGFKANAFNGVGFETIGFKPANFTYFIDQGVPEYMPRRALVKRLGLQSESQLIGHPNAGVNLFPLLPTYEMLVLFDKRAHEKLKQKPIYNIDPSDYKNA